MSNDPNKLNFDPIPVSAPSRPELPKVPDLPMQKAIAAAKAQPVETPAAPPTVPAATSWLPDSVWSVFEPSRTKGVIAAGIISLVGGAATMKYVWPAKPPTTVAQAEPEPTAPLPPLNSAPVPESTKPKVDTVALTPIVPATGSTMLPVPNVTLPPLVVSPPAIATVPPVPAPSVSSGTNIPLPSLVIPTAGSDPAVPSVPVPVPVAKPEEKSSTLKLPELVPSGGTTPAVPGALALPLPSTAAALPMPAGAPAPLPVPEIKLDLPSTVPAVSQTGISKVEVPKEFKFEPLKDAKVEPPPLTPLPVEGATVVPKLPEIGVPAAPKVDAAVPTPKFELSTPVPDVKPLVSPAVELPKVSPLPATAPAPTIAASNAKTEYDVDLHYVKSGDTWAAISKLHFGDERYADALKGYNQNGSLAQLQRAEIPPVHVLRKNYATLIGRPVEKAEWGTITPSSATLTSNEPKRSSVTGNGYKIYSVPAGGKTLKEIAADAYGDEGRWGMVWDTNPKLVPDKTVPEGTKIYLTSQSKIGD